MVNRISLSFALVVGFVGASGLSATGAEPNKPKEQAFSSLSLEVAALQTIYRFKMTNQQLSALRKMAPETAAKGENRSGGKGNNAVRSTLLDLRSALIQGEDLRIEECEDKLADLLDQDDFDLDDAINLTPGARKRTSEFLVTLTARQTAAFIIANEDVPDPLERLHEALDVAAKADDADWKEIAESIVEDLGWQIGGLDVDRCRQVENKVKDYLKKVRSLSAKDLEKQRGELEKSARQIVSQVSPTFILHNVVEHHVAELLSNPRLVAAIDALLSR